MRNTKQKGNIQSMNNDNLSLQAKIDGRCMQQIRQQEQYNAQVQCAHVYS